MMLGYWLKHWKIGAYFLSLFLVSFFASGMLYARLAKKTVKTAPSQSTRSASRLGAMIASLPSPESASAPVAEEKVKVVPVRGQVAGYSSYTRKDVYKIAAVGDSMVETMGDSLDYLKEALKERYPNTEFVMYNYAQGAINVTEGLARFNEQAKVGENTYPPLTKFAPDVLIVGSFAYNPYEEHNPDRYWSELAVLISKAKYITQNTYLLAEIGPLYYGFGEGIGGVNWPVDVAQEHSLKIKRLLENAVGLSRATNTHLIDAYSPSLTKAGFVDPKYVDTHDGIHPSEEGHRFMAKLIASEIRFD